jgi:hypothetical protein
MKKQFFLWIIFIFFSFVFIQCGTNDDGPFLTIERRSSVPSIKEVVIVHTVEKADRKTDMEKLLNYQINIVSDTSKKVNQITPY